MLFLPDLLEVMSNGRIVCSYTLEDRVLLRHFRDLPPTIHLHPAAITRLDELDQDVLNLAELATTLPLKKELVFLPQIRTLVKPLQTRSAKHDYLSLFVDTFSLGFGLSRLGAAHFAKVLLEEFVEHFLPEDFPIDESFNWKSFKDIANLNDPNAIQQKPFKQLRGNADADPTIIFEKLLPSASNKDRTLRRVDLLIKLQENTCTKWVGFITRNHFLNLYLRNDISYETLNDFSKAVKTLLVHHGSFFPFKSTLYKQ